MKTVYFAMKETTYNRYSVTLPKEMENATEEEIKKYITEKDPEIQYEKHLDSENQEFDFDYEFDIRNY